jgi:16S rRNA (adenine1518-N6/adenine1519-N6)-dimethyltransferase
LELFNAASPRELKLALTRYGVELKKGLGQNFLVDENILNKIIIGAQIQQDSIVLEIGPGAGALTQKLCQAGARVIALEIDKTLQPLLDESLEGLKAKVIYQDFLKSDLDDLFSKEIQHSFKVCANLPYQITSAAIFKLLGIASKIHSMTLMVQSEVGQRLTATHGKQYSPFSIAVNYHARVENFACVPPGCFMPRPKVSSALIRLDIREEKAVQVDNEELFFSLVRQSFSMRRKTLLNNLHAGKWGVDKKTIEEILCSCGIPINARAEEIMINQYAKISNSFSKYIE